MKAASVITLIILGVFLLIAFITFIVTYSNQPTKNFEGHVEPPTGGEEVIEKHRSVLARLKSNCAELLHNGQHQSGVYAIQPDKSQAPFDVFCDMTKEGGGWTMFQRRGVLNIPKPQRENFYRNWTEYKNGFGSVGSDYWLVHTYLIRGCGLDKVYRLTLECDNELLVSLTRWDGTTEFARYGQFKISNEHGFYQLSIGNYSGNAGDGLLYHNKMKFSTYDKQNDQVGVYHDEACATKYKGAWWYRDCFWSNLNGEYGEDGSNGVMLTRSGMEWEARHYRSYMKTEMGIRQKC